MSQNDSRWAVAKDGGMFDQFTGATITPRAVVEAVKETALYFKENQDYLFTQKNDCQLKKKISISTNKEKAIDDNEN